MTPASLRSAIASARLRPRMYTPTPGTLAIALYWLVSGAAAEDIGALWGDAYYPADPLAPTDAEVCDAAEATVAALWPQGDAPAGDECAAFSDVPLDTPMPPAFVAALAALSPAQPGELDLDALHARLWSPTCSQCGAVDPPTEDAERWDGQRFRRHVDCPKPDDLYASEVGDHGLTRAEQRALVARVRELEALVPSERDRRDTTALHGLYADGERESDRLAAEVERLRAQLAARDRRDAAVQAFVASMPGNEDRCPQCDGQPLAEGTVCATCWYTGRNDAAQPAPLDFYGALAAVRNGRFVPPSEWVRCLACGGTGADVDGAPCEPCRGTGLQPPPSDADLCPKCGALDLDHVCPKSAATVAGEAFAAEHPYAAGAIMGGVAKREDGNCG